MGGAVHAVTDAEFESRVLQSQKPVLVDFWATWCGPCRMIAPVVEQLAGEIGDKVEFLKLDVDQNPQTAQRFGVLSIPTVIVFKDGRPAARAVGYKGGLKEELKQQLVALA
jgi:thioredoxin 1